MILCDNYWTKKSKIIKWMNYFMIAEQLEKFSDDRFIIFIFLYR